MQISTLEICKKQTSYPYWQLQVPQLAATVLASFFIFRKYVVPIPMLPGGFL